MYSPEERNMYLNKATAELASSHLVEGIVQIGSGVVGFSDGLSDIDLMVATSKVEDAMLTKQTVYRLFSEFNPLYMKEKPFGNDIFLVIVMMENGLEFNVSIVPRALLSVKSPLWKVLIDKTGLVTEKMKREQHKFESIPVKYEAGFDVPFEFVYCATGLNKALKRNNVIYALSILEKMRAYTLYVQAMNENKKLHQFKAYDTLEPSFIQEYLSTYPEEMNVKSLKDASERLKKLFINVLDRSTVVHMDPALQHLFNASFV